MFNNISPPPRKLCLCEIMWKYNVEPDMPQMKTEHDACALHAGQQRLQTLTQNMLHFRFSTGTMIRRTGVIIMFICTSPVLI